MGHVEVQVLSGLFPERREGERLVDSSGQVYAIGGVEDCRSAAARVRTQRTEGLVLDRIGPFPTNELVTRSSLGVAAIAVTCSVHGTTIHRQRPTSLETRVTGACLGNGVARLSAVLRTEGARSCTSRVNDGNGATELCHEDRMRSNRPRSTCVSARSENLVWRHQLMHGVSGRTLRTCRGAVLIRTPTHEVIVVRIFRIRRGERRQRIAKLKLEIRRANQICAISSIGLEVNTIQLLTPHTLDL